MQDQAQKLRELTRANERSYKSSTPIISVTSGKGGTGKSFAAFYLSQFLSAKGFKTLLIELDFNLSALSFHLDIEPASTIYNFFMGSSVFDELPLEVSQNFSIIFGDNGKLNFPENRQAYIRNFFNLLYDKAEEYDVVILDNGAGIGNEIIEIIKNSSINLIVTLPDTVAVMDAYVVVKMMMKHSVNIPVGIIINKCRTIEEGETAFKNLNSATAHFFSKQLNLIGIIKESSKLNDIQLLELDSLQIDLKNGTISDINSAVNKLSSFAQLANNHH